MTIRQICTADVDSASRDDSAWQAAARMRQRAVGSLVVVNEARQPIGIITDRDLVERVLADAKDPGATLVEEVMTRAPQTISANDSVQTALALMREGGFRRLPVADEDGSLVGLVTLDDLLMLLADEMSQIGNLVRRETPRAVAEEPVQSRWDQN